MNFFLICLIGKGGWKLQVDRIEPKDDVRVLDSVGIIYYFFPLSSPLPRTDVCPM